MGGAWHEEKSTLRNRFEPACGVGDQREDTPAAYAYRKKRPIQVPVDKQLGGRLFLEPAAQQRCSSSTRRLLL